MGFLDFLTGEDQIKNIKAYKENFTGVNQLGLANQRASTGMDDIVENMYRDQNLKTVFRPADYTLYGGDQNRAIAGQFLQDQASNKNLSDFNFNLSMQDYNMRQQGEGQAALLSDQKLEVNERNALREVEVENAKAVARAQARSAVVGGLMSVGANAIGAGAFGGFFDSVGDLFDNFALDQGGDVTQALPGFMQMTNVAKQTLSAAGDITDFSRQLGEQMGVPTINETTGPWAEQQMNPNYDENAFWLKNYASPVNGG